MRIVVARQQVPVNVGKRLHALDRRTQRVWVGSLAVVNIAGNDDVRNAVAFDEQLVRILRILPEDVLARTYANDFRLVVNHPIYQASFPAMRLERDTDREIHHDQARQADCHLH